MFGVSVCVVLGTVLVVCVCECMQGVGVLVSVLPNVGLKLVVGVPAAGQSLLKSGVGRREEVLQCCAMTLRVYFWYFSWLDSQSRPS